MSTLSLIVTILLGGALFGAAVLWLYLDAPVVRSGQSADAAERRDGPPSPSTR